jgi:hypothetical protein
MTRREVLRIGGLTLILSPWARAVQSESGAFEFIVVNDTHYIDAMCERWHSAVAAAMHASAPDAAFCVHAGDVADRGDLEACKMMKEIYGNAMGRLYTVPGNHDFISNDDRSGYDTVFPERLNYTFQHLGWQFLALDTTQGTQFDGTDISSTTFAWLDENLPKLDQKAPTFVFTHFPLGEGTVYRPRNADALIEHLLRLNVAWIHCGHWHGDSSRKAGPFTASTSRCCARLRENRDGSPLKGWHVYRAEADGKLSRRFVAIPKL